MPTRRLEEVWFARRMMGKKNHGINYPSDDGDKDVAEFMEIEGLSEDDFKEDLMNFISYGYGVSG